MNKAINILTSLFGLALIPFSALCFYTLEKVTGWDFLLMILAAGFLLYIKNNKASTMISEIFTSKNLKR